MQRITRWLGTLCSVLSLFLCAGSAVLWWLRGWLVGRKLTEFPEAVERIGPVDGPIYESRDLD